MTSPATRLSKDTRRVLAGPVGTRNNVSGNGSEVVDGSSLEEFKPVCTRSDA
jgi:hypothetical protein